MKQVCTGCKLRVTKIKTHRVTYNKKSRYRYVDQNGSPWGSGKCPSCNRAKAILYGRLKGDKPIDEVLTQSQRVGRESEWTARRFFEAMGFEVQMTTLLGPDLILKKDGIQTTVEVKTVLSGRNTKYVHAVTPSRKSDRLIAFVYKDQVRVQPMKYHLSCASKCGKRTVTGLFI